MSKSLGNIVTIRKVAETHDLEALRLLFIGVHYRSAVGFTLAKDDQQRPVYPELDAAEERLDYFYRTLGAASAEAPAGDDRGARPARGRKDAFQFPGSYGRRLQRRRRRRPPV